MSETKKIILTMENSFYKTAEAYVKRYGYLNIQELISESLREKIFGENPKHGIKIKHRRISSKN